MTDQPYLEFDPLSDTIHFHCEATDIEVEIKENENLWTSWSISDYDHQNTLTKIRATQEGR